MPLETLLNLRIGGLAMQFAFNREDVLPALERRYRGFVSPHSTGPHLRMRLELLPSTHRFEDPIFDFRDGVLRFSHPDYTGWVHPSGECFLRTRTCNPVEAVEYFLRAACAVIAFQEGGLLVHAAGIVRAGRGYLFFGHSGSGKTTVARLSGVENVLNDDLILLMPGDQGWRAFSTPFWNPTQAKPNPGSAPLKGLYRLVQAEEVRSEPLPPSCAAAELFSCLPVLPRDPGLASPLLERAIQVLHSSPAYALHFLPDPSFWAVIEQQ